MSAVAPTEAASRGASAPAALDVHAVVPDRGLDIGLRVEAGEVVAVMGPNGAGKTTLLAVVAGLVATRGHVRVGGRAVDDPRSRVWVPPHRRGAALLEQEALLFPHLSAAENVAFGPRSRGHGRRASRAEAARWLAAVDATDLAARRPNQLSGGQAQRVALARALAAEPAVLLLDEPLAALDVEYAYALRRLLRTVLRDGRRTSVLVTHDILDALAIADRVLVVDGGRVVEQGAVREVFARPRSAFGATVAGVNLVSGTAAEHGLRLPDGRLVHGIVDPACVPDQPAVALFSPRAVAVFLTAPAGSPRNHVTATITELERRGEIVRVRTAQTPGGLPGLLADVTPAAVADLDLRPGLEVHLAVKATEVGVHPRAAPAGA